MMTDLGWPEKRDPIYYHPLYLKAANNLITTYALLALLHYAGVVLPPVT